MSSKILMVFLLGLALLATTGCFSSNVDKHWGEAFYGNYHKQIDAPELAEANATEPSPQGTDGRSAEDAMAGYRSAQRPGGGSQAPLPMIVTGSQSLGR